MSLDANIDIHFEHLSFKKVIDLLSSDWKIDYHEHIEYMDNDDFEWKSEILQNEDDVLKLLEKRYNSNNPVGIAMVTKTDNSGGMFLFYPNENILSVVININRKKVNHTALTDFSYYISHLNLILNNLYKIQCTDIV
jgi:hypothetical protein